MMETRMDGRLYWALELGLLGAQPTRFIHLTPPIIFSILFLLVIGTKWTFEIWDSVSYSDPLSLNSSFCPEFLYTFTYVVIICLWVVMGLALTCGLLAKFCSCFYDILCCKPCKSGNQAV